MLFLLLSLASFVLGEFYRLEAVDTTWEFVQDTSDSLNRQKGVDWQTPSVDFPGSRQHQAFCHIPGTTKLVMFGGYDSSSASDSIWEFDRTNENWSENLVVTRPTARDGCDFVAMGSYGCVLFGGSGVPAEVWKYDSTGTFELLSLSSFVSEPEGRGYNQIWAAKDEQTLLVWGGYGGTYLGGPLFWIDVAGSSSFWQNATTSNDPSDRRGASTWTDFRGVSEYYYLFGGAAGGTYGDTYRLDRLTLTWEEVSSENSLDTTSTSFVDYVNPGQRANSYGVQFSQYAFVYGGNWGGYVPSMFMFDVTAAETLAFPNDKGWALCYLAVGDDAPGGANPPVYPPLVDARPNGRWTHKMALMEFQGNIEIYIFGGIVSGGGIALDLWRASFNVSRGLSTCGTISALVSPSTVCSGRGSCFQFDVCTCDDDQSFIGSECETPACYGVEASVACNSGTCADGECSCPDEWTGQECAIPACYGIDASLPDDVCNGEGTCSGGVCTCTNPNFAGSECDLPACYGIEASLSGSVCNGEGTCADGVCTCTNLIFAGDECNLPACYGVDANASDVCSGNGNCDSGSCGCVDGWEGDECDIELGAGGFLGTGLSVAQFAAAVGGAVGGICLCALFVAFICVLFFCCRRPKVNVDSVVEPKETKTQDVKLVETSVIDTSSDDSSSSSS